MNKIYRLVRNPSTGQLTVASELARAHGKGKALAIATGALAAGIALSPAALAQQAPTLHWDGGSSGEWQAPGGDTNWRDGADSVAYSNGASVEFSDPAFATVTITGPVIANSLRFSSPGYTITGDTLTLGSAGLPQTNAVIEVLPDITATLSANLYQADPQNFIKSGAGILRLNGNNSLATAENQFLKVAKGQLAFDGGTTTTQQLVIHSDAPTGSPADSSVSVANADTRLVIKTTLEVGTNTYLDIANGAVVTSGDNRFGISGIVKGAASVSGAGSRWMNNGSLTIEDNGTRTGELNILDGGNVSSGMGLIATNQDSSGIVNVTGAGSLWAGTDHLSVGGSGNGTLNLEAGGKVTSATGSIGDSSTGVGTVNIIGSGSSWTTAEDLSVGYSGEGTLRVANGGNVSSGNLDIGAFGHGTLLIENGGTATSASSIIGGHMADAIGKATVSGIDSRWENNGLVTVGIAGKGTLDIHDGGTVTASGILLAQQSGSAGTLNIGAAAGQTPVAAGTLVAPTITFGAGLGILNFNHTGLYRSAVSFADGSPVAARINQIAGTTELTGDSSAFVGTTYVTGGVLRVDGVLGDRPSAVNVSNNGTLSGAGKIGGSVIFSSGGVLAPGGSTDVGTLTIDGDLKLSENSVLNYRLGKAGAVGGAYNDLVKVNGDLVLDGTLNVAVSRNGAFGAGSYRLIDYKGSLTDNGLTLGNMPAGGDNTVQTSIANQVNLVNSGSLELKWWDGDGNPDTKNDGLIQGGNGSWTAAANGNNWTTQDGLHNGAFRADTYAIFGGTAGTVTVDNGAGPVQVSGMQFTTDGYRIQDGEITLASGVNAIRVGDGISTGLTATIASDLTGTGSLEKTDLGTLVLAGNNTYTGDTTISSGVLQISADHNLGAANGALILGGASYQGTLATTADMSSARAITLQGSQSTFDTQAGTTLTLSGPLGGSGTLIKQGLGTLALTGSNAIGMASDQTLQVAMGTLALKGGVTQTNALTISNAAAAGQNGVSISGPNTRLEVKTHTQVGKDAALTITEGAVATSGGDSVISGNANVSGQDAQWTHTGDWTVGNLASDTSTATVSDDAQLQVLNGSANIAYAAGSQARVEVSTGGALTNNATLFVGMGGAGTLAIQDAGTVTSKNVHVAHARSAIGAITVSGANAQWNISDFLAVGKGGAGTLDIRDGGLVNSLDTEVGSDNGSTGTVTVGADGVWNNAGRIIVGGYNANGTLAIQAGGEIASGHGTGAFDPRSYIGYGMGSVGIATVAGAGALWNNTNDLLVGYMGTGTLDIGSGGTTTNSTAVVGYGATGTGAKGSVTVAGADAHWQNTGMLAVGQGASQGTSATGTLKIGAGGTVSNTDATIGVHGNATGSVVVKGMDALWQNSGELIVGQGGTGMLDILDGGRVTSMRSQIGDQGDSYAGSANVGKGNGSVTVAGIDAHWQSGASLKVGDHGTGTLNIRDGGKVTTGLDGSWIGAMAGATGTATVDGTGTLWDTGALLTVGDGGSGTLNILNGGKVTTGPGGGWIGRTTNSVGTVTVDGTNAIWTNIGAVAIGNAGKGTLDIRNGGTISGGQILLAAQAGSVGTLNIGAAQGQGAVAAGVLDISPLVPNAATILFGPGNGTLTFNHTSTSTNPYESGMVLSGGTTNIATLNHSAGNTRLTGDSQDFGGTTLVSGGVLRVDGTLGNSGSLMTVANGGTLGGSGTIGGSVNILDGHLSPGNSTGTLTINGNLYLSAGSILDYELGQANAVGGDYNDLTVIAGNLVLDGTLNITQSAGGNFGAGIYRLIDYSGTLIDNGLALGNMPAGTSNSVQTSVAHQINLINNGGLLLKWWDGNGPANDGLIQGGDGTWTAAASGSNWTTSDGAINGAYQDSTYAIFTGNAGTVTVDTSAGPVRVSGMQFAIDGYRIEGDEITLTTGANAIRVGDSTIAGADFTAIVDANLIGTGSLDKVDLGTLVLTGTNTYSGGTRISSGTLQLGDGGTTGSIVDGDIDNAGTFAFNRSNAVQWNGSISGSGTVSQLGDGTTTLNGANTYTGGTLISGGVLAGSASSFGSGAIVDNATLRIDQGNDATFVNQISGSGNLIKNGNGVLNLTGSNSYAGGTTITDGVLAGSATSFGSGDIINNATLELRQGNDALLVNTISGSGGLVKNGNGVLNLTGANSYSGGTRIDAGVLTGSASSFGSGAIVDNATLRIDQSTDATFANQISGSGMLIKNGGGVLDLTGTNLHTGGTTIADGTLRIATDANLGAASGALTLGDASHNGTLATTADIDSTRAVTLQGDRSAFDTGTGTRLTLGGAISGDGGLVKRGDGTLILSAANRYTGGTSVEAGVLIGDAGSIRGDLANQGTTLFAQNEDGAFAGNISGGGDLHKQGDGQLSLLGTSSVGWHIDAGSLRTDAGRFSGDAVIDTGARLVFDQAGDADYAGQLSGTGGLNKTGNGALTLSGGNTLSGATTVEAGRLRAGGIGMFSTDSAHAVANGGTLDLAGFDQTVASLQNSGVVVFSPSAARAGTTLTVSGDYVGNDGTLAMNARLEDDRSITDKLVVEGDTSGRTFVQVTNVGGTGALSENGIELVSVAGASAGEFELRGRAVGGAYEYALVKGGRNTPNDGQWYLRSEVPGMLPPVDPEVDPSTPTLRPEPAAYLGNQNAALRMFQHTMHDRVGEPGLTARDDDGQGYAAWVRVQNRNLDAGTVGGQINIDSNANIVQMGVEKQFAVGEGRIHAGVMGGYGRATTDGVSNFTDHRARGELKGNNLGVYGTWFQNGEGPQGLYVDGSAHYARFDNTVKGDHLGREQYDSRVWSGSLETGYAMRLHEGTQSALYIEPQAQVIYTDFSSDDVREDNGTLVQTRKAGGTTTRLGVRLYSRPTSTQYNRVQPFVAVNWWSGGNESTIAMDGERLSRDLPKNTYEAKVGAQLELGSGWSGWGQVGYQQGSNGYRDLNGQVGVKLSW